MTMIHTYRIALLFVLLLAALALSACGGSGGATIADVIEQAGGQAAAGEEDSAAGPQDQAKATVTARSLRVRGAPSPTGEVVGGVKEGEVYDVVGLSSDGEWIQLAVPAIPGGSGWVSANFVEVQGSITEAAILEAVPTVAVTAATTAETVTTETVTAGAISLPTPTRAPQIAADPGTATVANTEGVRLRVRAQPSADAEIVGYVYDGEVYPVVETSADGLWTQIGGLPDTDNVNGGWVASEFLVLN
jgi:uncharacterized protein YgiM (DUF1202 family)